MHLHRRFDRSALLVVVRAGLALVAGMITWLSTKSPIRMLDARINRAQENYLRKNGGIDSALLAAELGLCLAHVEARQRRLGLRAFAPTGKRKRY
jgi:hypothetical protein